MMKMLCASMGLAWMLAASTAAASLSDSEATISSKGQILGSDDDNNKQSKFYLNSVKSHLSIQIPASLHNPKGEAHELAHFGLMQPRGSMSRFVYFTERSLCHPDALGGINSTFPKIDNSKQETALVHPFFVLAKGGGTECTPVRMARNAQEFGASALILGEEWCRCDDKNCTLQFPSDEYCLPADPPLSNDGSALDVSIPTALIRKQTAGPLYKAMKMDNQRALVQLAWGLPLSEEDLPDDDAENENRLAKIFEPHYHLWSSAHDPLFGARGYHHLRALAVAFGRTVHFSPRYYIQDGKRFGCTGHADTETPEQSPCSELCTHNGKYCSSHAIDDVSGRAIVIETIRRLCIHKHYPAFPEDDDSGDDHINTVYFDYIIHHIEQCVADPSKYSNEECIEEAYNKAGIDKESIELCMKDTGSVDSSESNSLLDEMLDKQKLSGVVEIPALTINNQLFVDKPSARTLFGELCSHYWEATVHSPFNKEEKLKIQMPSVCETCGSCANVVGCIQAGRCVPYSREENYDDIDGGGGDDNNNSKGKKRGGHGWTITFLLLAAIGAGGAYVYYKRREEFGDSGAGLLDAYMPMSSS